MFGNWTLMNSSSRRKTAPKPIEDLAHYVEGDPVEEPVRFVRDLAQYWKARGGIIAGKPRHSDRHLDVLLRRQGTPIKSLTPKLVGRTHVSPADAGALVRLFLSHWDYVGGSNSTEGAEGSPDLYKPLLSDDEIGEVARYVVDRISELGREAKGESESTASPSIPWRRTMEVIATEFENSIALFSVGPGQSVLVSHPEMALIGFRNLMNELWKIDRSDDQERILVWALDLGRQDFEDPESRLRFVNAESLMTRFKALKRFQESDTEARWSWLTSRTVILVHDTRSVRPDMPRLPAFDPHHILFDAIPPRWVRSPEFSLLYGTSFERLHESNYTIFLRRSVIQSSDEIGVHDEIASRARQSYNLGYFGHALLEVGQKGQRQTKGLELDPLGRSYVDALGTVFVAAREMLGLRNASADLLIDGMKIDQAYATEKLRHHGFVLQSIDEFLRL
jgi:hypothetical protein